MQPRLKRKSSGPVELNGGTWEEVKGVTVINAGCYQGQDENVGPVGCEGRMEANNVT